MYQFIPLDRKILMDPTYVSGSIPIYHAGFKDQKEPYIISTEILVRGPDGFHTTIPKGFKYDMASVPWTFTRLIPKAHPQIVRAATLHDWLYDQRIGTREEADNHFLNIMRQDGFNLSMPAYLAVKMFGQKAWDT